MQRESALKLMEDRISNKNLRKHMLSVEACMVALAKHFNEDVESWGLAGLLHDLDYNETENNPEKHALITEKILTEQGVSESIIHSIKAHCGNAEILSKMDQSIYAVDPLTGLIIASVLMHPTKKINNVDTAFVMKRFKEKRFAAGANREQIKSCEKLGLSLEEFISICLKAMQGINEQLEL